MMWTCTLLFSRAVAVDVDGGDAVVLSIRTDSVFCMLSCVADVCSPTLDNEEILDCEDELMDECWEDKCPQEDEFVFYNWWLDFKCEINCEANAAATYGLDLNYQQSA